MCVLGPHIKQVIEAMQEFEILETHLHRYLCKGKKGSPFEPPTHTRDVPTIIVAAPLHQDLCKTENPFLTLLAS